MKIRSTLLLAGVVLSAWATCAPAAVTSWYENNFDASSNPIGAGWDPSLPLSRTNTASPFDTDPSRLHTQFLGDFGGQDQVHLHLALPQNVSSVTLSFDVYLLRTWDGEDPRPIANHRPGEPAALGGPDVFGYGYNGNTVLEASFSHGAGEQTYCPRRASPCISPANGFPGDTTFDYPLLDKLGYAVLLDPHDISPNVPQIGQEMSMVYHLTSTIPYTGSDITFDFFSKGLQVHDPNDPTDGVARLSDESWGLDNVKVGVMFVPEPQVWALLFAGLLFSSYAATRRRRLQR